jgi:hypothetical protein
MNWRNGLRECTILTAGTSIELAAICIENKLRSKLANKQIRDVVANPDSTAAEIDDAAIRCRYFLSCSTLLTAASAFIAKGDTIARQYRRRPEEAFTCRATQVEARCSGSAIANQIDTDVRMKYLSSSSKAAARIAMRAPTAAATNLAIVLMAAIVVRRRTWAHFRRKAACHRQIDKKSFPHCDRLLSTDFVQHFDVTVIFNRTAA